MSEVAEHRTREDAWSVFNGKVYNITPYLHFHPGGVGELMRAAGRDGESCACITLTIHADQLVPAHAGTELFSTLLKNSVVPTVIDALYFCSENTRMGECRSHDGELSHRFSCTRVSSKLCTIISISLQCFVCPSLFMLAHLCIL